MTYVTKGKFVLVVTIGALILLLILFLSPFIGSVHLNISKVFSRQLPLRENPDAAIFFHTRLPRVLMACLAGAALACAGASFQALLRNPLATPYILGIAGGSSFGVVLAIKFQLHHILLGFPTLFIVAFIGASLATLVVYLLAQSTRGFAPTILILAGVTVNFFFAALILLVQYLSLPAQAYHMIRWMMGGVDVGDYYTILYLSPFVLLGLLLLFLKARELNLISISEETATQLGVNVRRSQRIIFFAASLLTAAVVSVCGPIGFIGLIIPHMLRLLTGPDHRLLLPCSALAGAGFLVICDTLSRTVAAPMEIPVGVITALTGGPFFLWLLLRKRGQPLFS